MLQYNRIPHFNMRRKKVIHGNQQHLNTKQQLNLLQSTNLNHNLRQHNTDQFMKKDERTYSRFSITYYMIQRPMSENSNSIIKFTIPAIRLPLAILWYHQ